MNPQPLTVADLNPDALYRPTAVAEVLDVNRATVISMITSKRLKGYRTGDGQLARYRVFGRDVMKFLGVESQMQPKAATIPTARQVEQSIADARRRMARTKETKRRVAKVVARK